MPNNPRAAENLIPAKPGEIRNPKGKPKGTKHISTWIQEMMNDEGFETYIQHPTKGYEPYKGAPLKAIIQTALRKAASGDDKAREWLAKYGWGNKVVHEFENSIFTDNKMEITIVSSDKPDPQPEATDSAETA